MGSIIVVVRRSEIPCKKLAKFFVDDMHKIKQETVAYLFFKLKKFHNLFNKDRFRHLHEHPFFWVIFHIRTSI